MARVVTIASLLLLTAFQCEVGAVGLPAGTTFDLVAGADYTDSVGVLRSAEPAFRTLVVRQVAASQIQILQYSSEVRPAETIYVPTKIVNAGNGNDVFILSVNAPAGWAASVLYDYDDDGVHDDYENTELADTGAIVPDGYLPCLVRITLPSQGTSSGTVNISARSTYDTAVVASGGAHVNYSEPPTIQVTTPSTEVEFARNSSILRLGGTATESSSITALEWSNLTTGACGLCSLDGNTWVSDDIQLEDGENHILLAASDSLGVAATASVRVSYIEASPGDAWRGLSMVSMPIIPDTTDPKAVANFDQDYWLCFDTNSYSYLRYPDQRAMLQPVADTPIRGFWTHFSDQEVNPVGTIPSQNSPVSIPLKAGWNLIGQPFIRPVRWDVDTIMIERPGTGLRSLRNSESVVTGFAWGWRQSDENPNTGGYYLVCDPRLMPASVGEMEPWHAYWVCAYFDCTLVLPPPDLQ